MNSMDAGGAALLTGYSVIIDVECDKSQSWLLELKMKRCRCRLSNLPIVAKILKYFLFNFSRN